MFKVLWIVDDINFLSAVSDRGFNKHFKWYQGMDQKLGSHGYLAPHRSIRYCIQLRDLKLMEDTWKESPTFQAY